MSDQQQSPPALPAPENTTGTGAQRDTSGRFLPGQTGNAGGRPKSQWIKDFLGVSDPRGPGKTRKQWLLESLWTTAIDRNHRDHVKAAVVLLAYDVGKPVETVELSGPDGGPVPGAPSAMMMTTEQRVRRFSQIMQKAAATAADDAAAEVSAEPEPAAVETPAGGTEPE